MCPAVDWGPRVLPRDRLLLRPSLPHRPFGRPGSFHFYLVSALWPATPSRPLHALKGTSMSTIVLSDGYGTWDGSANYTLVPVVMSLLASVRPRDPLLISPYRYLDGSTVLRLVAWVSALNLPFPRPSSDGSQTGLEWVWRMQGTTCHQKGVSDVRAGETTGKGGLSTISPSATVTATAGYVSTEQGRHWT